MSAPFHPSLCNFCRFNSCKINPVRWSRGPRKWRSAHVSRTVYFRITRRWLVARRNIGRFSLGLGDRTLRICRDGLSAWISCRLSALWFPCEGKTSLGGSSLHFQSKDRTLVEVRWNKNEPLLSRASSLIRFRFCRTQDQRGKVWERKVGSYWGMFIISSNAVRNVLIVSVILEKCIIACTCDAQAAPGISGLFACIYAVNITQRLRRSYKIGECVAKYRLSFTKIKYSEHNKSVRRIL